MKRDNLVRDLWIMESQEINAHAENRVVLQTACEDEAAGVSK